jgi:hypothetical protein
MGFLVEELVGLVLWLVANWTYVQARRTGRHGFTRLLAFFFGLPGTVATLFLVREGSQPRLAPPPDDEEGLLAEVRRARALSRGEDVPGAKATTPERREGS